MKIATKPVINDVPENHIVEHFGFIKLLDMYIVVHHSKNAEPYKDWQIKAGKENESLKSIKITGDVERYRDGGTTVIQSEIGLFYLAAPRNRSRSYYKDTDGNRFYLAQLYPFCSYKY